MVTTEVCRNLIGIIGKYVDPITAQFFVEKYCNVIKCTTENFQHSDVPKFILYIANKRENLTRINDNQFEKLLKDLMDYSNLDLDKLKKTSNNQDDIIYI